LTNRMTGSGLRLRVLTKQVQWNSNQEEKK
jgi:hypothetical protein